MKVTPTTKLTKYLQPCCLRCNFMLCMREWMHTWYLDEMRWDFGQGHGPLMLLSTHTYLKYCCPTTCPWIPKIHKKKNNGNQTCLTRWSLVSHSIISLQNHTTITHIVVLGGTWFSLLLIFSIEYLEWNIFSNSWAKLSYANSTIPLFWTKERQISKHLTTL